MLHWVTNEIAFEACTSFAIFPDEKHDFERCPRQAVAPEGGGLAPVQGGRGGAAFGVEVGGQKSL